MSRILVYRAIGLGDLLTGVPALRAVARAFPSAEVCLAAPAPLAPLVPLIGAVRTHVPTGELQPPPWSGPPPALAVNLHGRGPQSHRLLQALTPRRLVAFASRPAGGGLAAPPPPAPLVPLIGPVRTHAPTGELQPPPWSAPPPALAVTLHGRGPQSHRLLRALTPRRLVAFASRPAGVDGPRW